MRLTSLRLHDFRSYENLLFTPPDGITALVGQNGTGKTNLLEAVHLCCLGRSHRTSSDGELLRYGCDTAAVQVRVARADGTDEVGVRLYAQQRRKKLLYINGKTAQRMGELMGHVTCVMFSPEDLDIIKGAPASRRRFLDMLLSQHSKGYFYALQTYNAALKQRNALLKSIASGAAKQSQLREWDDALCDACAPVARARREACQRLDALCAAHYAFISAREGEDMRLCYAGHLSQCDDPRDELRRLLASHREEDLRRMTTSCGPHRDDITLTLCNRSLQAYGSQGQMRTAVLSMRLAELDLLKTASGESPLLLLDDVLSELDATRRTRLLSRLCGLQTLLTCTDLSDLSGAKPAAVLHVSLGHITA